MASRAWPIVIVMLTGCTVGGDAFEEEDEYADPGVQPGDGKTDSSTSVDTVARTSCSTIPVRGLSIQIAEELRCMVPDLLVPLAPSASVRFESDAVLPYLEADTAAALLRAASASGGVSLASGMRSMAQQFLLHRWAASGRCGITMAALPGRSNHETGRALDVANAGKVRNALLGNGFSSLSKDPVHFDYLASPDLRSDGVEAFQRLWNRNHPEDPIVEDGIFGPQTSARLARSPSGGFATSGCDAAGGP